MRRNCLWRHDLTSGERRRIFLRFYVSRRSAPSKAPNAHSFDMDSSAFICAECYILYRSATMPAMRRAARRRPPCRGRGSGRNGAYIGFLAYKDLSTDLRTSYPQTYAQANSILVTLYFHHVARAARPNARAARGRKRSARFDRQTAEGKNPPGARGGMIRDFRLARGVIVALSVTVVAHLRALCYTWRDTTIQVIYHRSAQEVPMSDPADPALSVDPATPLDPPVDPAEATPQPAVAPEEISALALVDREAAARHLDDAPPPAASAPQAERSRYPGGLARFER